MRQATLVAFYGPKSAALAALLGECQRMLVESLGCSFKPYDVAQIHATIIGLEQMPEVPNHNLNLARYRDTLAQMDLEGFLASLRTNACFPLCVQIGGFSDRDYPFTSRGCRPFARSFSLQGTRAVLMGWPVRGRCLTSAGTTPTYSAIQKSRLYPASLEDVRRSALKFNILHQYHKEVTDVDNDFYLRLGVCEAGHIDPRAGRAIEIAIRRYLSEIDPVFIEVTAADLHVVSYVDESLACASTRSRRVGLVWITRDFTSALYQE